MILNVPRTLDLPQFLRKKVNLVSIIRISHPYKWGSAKSKSKPGDSYTNGTLTIYASIGGAAFSYFLDLFQYLLFNASYKPIHPMFYMILFFGLMVSCTENNRNSPKEYSFELVDSITLEPMTTVNVNSMCVKYYEEEDKEYLFWGNRGQNSIEMFDLDGGEHVNTLEFPREGPNSISKIVGGFTIINLDSIFISNSGLAKIYMFDSASVLKKIFFHSDTSYFSANNTISLNTKIHSDIYRNQGKLIFPLSISGFRTPPSDSTVHSLQVVKLFDLRTQSFSNSDLHFDPEIYKPFSLFLANSNAMLDSRFYYQIATQSAIRFTDDFKIKKKKDAKSRFHSKYIKMSDYSDIYEFISLLFSYYSLISDPYRNVLYRTVKLPVKDMHSADKEKEFDNILERASIMVLNKDLDILGEYLFDHSEYSWNECFVGKKGFYLLRSSYHPNYFEPRITYDIYEFRQNSHEEFQ